MQRYLVYDAGCSTCSRIADTVQQAAGGKLRPISIRSDEAKSLLDRAYPEGWKFAPYLVRVDGARVSAQTGFGAAVRLALLMGPRKSWRVWSLAHRSGVPLPPGSKAAVAYDASRRQFLKLGVAAAAAVGAMGWAGSRRAPGVVADPQCYTCAPGTYSCSTYVGFECLNQCPQYITCTEYDLYDCYDTCGYYCGRMAFYVACPSDFCC